jgi:hypothetical protein
MTRSASGAYRSFRRVSRASAIPFIESDEEAGIRGPASERHPYRAMTRSASGAYRSFR